MQCSNCFLFGVKYGIKRLHQPVIQKLFATTTTNTFANSHLIDFTVDFLSVVFKKIKKPETLINMSLLWVLLQIIFLSHLSKSMQLPTIRLYPRNSISQNISIDVIQQDSAEKKSSDLGCPACPTISISSPQTPQSILQKHGRFAPLHTNLTHSVSTPQMPLIKKISENKLRHRIKNKRSKSLAAVTEQSEKYSSTKVNRYTTYTQPFQRHPKITYKINETDIQAKLNLGHKVTADVYMGNVPIFLEKSLNLQPVIPATVLIPVWILKYANTPKNPFNLEFYLELQFCVQFIF